MGPKKSGKVGPKSQEKWVGFGENPETYQLKQVSTLLHENNCTGIMTRYESHDMKMIKRWDDAIKHKQTRRPSIVCGGSLIEFAVHFLANFGLRLADVRAGGVQVRVDFATSGVNFT